MKKSVALSAAQISCAAAAVSGRVTAERSLVATFCTCSRNCSSPRVSDVNANQAPSRDTCVTGYASRMVVCMSFALAQSNPRELSCVLTACQTRYMKVSSACDFNFLQTPRNKHAAGGQDLLTFNK